ncbi:MULTISPECIES: type II toxin-antitoxin system RelE/ParE family toxin [unclassified Duganella]|jgi:phage-related protein|uniref:type II toxin-antitoxin system RelE/ParE family toxin n=1 Tax=unclassified Duganella TaxID=2636909 RepID=UPI000B800188|nr:MULTISPECIES: type II toxin-antitoxin system RelE/ParE family toxin [unclassified Duganella]
MPSTTLSVHFYVTNAGTEPVRDWLKSLEVSDRKRIGDDIKTVQYGWPLGMPLVRKMDQRLWEVRTSLQGRTARVLFTIEGGDMVLLHGFIKKSQQTPLADIRIAKQRMK